MTAEMPAIAPASGDSVTVLLWAVGVLFFTIVIGVRFALSRIEASERRCAKDTDEARAEARVAHAKIAEIQGGVIVEQARTQLATNHAIEKIANATNNLTAEIRTSRERREKRERDGKDETSDLHRAIRDLGQA